jgi:nucleotidyltransferase/DNA polymerase involved in DNA repair
VLKLRYSNFHTISRQNSAPIGTADADEIVSRAHALLDAVVGEGDMFRLIGVHCTNLAEVEGAKGQLGLWSGGDEEGPQERHPGTET